MKKNSQFAIVIAALVSSFAWANEQKSADQHPCKVIIEACKGAGFIKGGHKESKGLFKDCMGPILQGQSIPGVNVDSSVVQACQKKKEIKKSMHSAR